MDRTHFGAVSGVLVLSYRPIDQNMQRNKSVIFRCNLAFKFEIMMKQFYSWCLLLMQLVVTICTNLRNTQPSLEFHY
jgi:hypothetical protein